MSSDNRAIEFCEQDLLDKSLFYFRKSDSVKHLLVRVDRYRARVLDIPPFLAASTRASGNRLEDNTLNASSLPGSNVRDVRNFRRRINPPFPRDIPGAESSKVSSDSTDVGRTCCLSCLSLSLSLAVPLVLFSSRSFRSPPSPPRSLPSPPPSHVEVNRETDISHTSRFFTRFRYSRVGAVKR